MEAAIVYLVYRGYRGMCSRPQIWIRILGFLGLLEFSRSRSPGFRV